MEVVPGYINNTQEMMKLLKNSPEVQEGVLKLLNIYQNLAAQEKNPLSYDNCKMIETGPISEDVVNSQSDYVRINDQTQVVMTPSILPVDRPNYTMNTVAGKNSQLSGNLPVAVPTEHTSNITVTEESTITEYDVPMETGTSDNIILSADEISLCKKAKVCHGIVKQQKNICSDQMQIPDSESQLYTFCDKINSPEYGLDEILENPIAPSSLPDGLMSSPEYAISPKALPVISYDGWNDKDDGMESCDNSICQDSDWENDAWNDAWNDLKDLQNIMKEFASSPASSVSTLYDLVEQCDTEKIDNQNMDLSYDDDSIISVLSPATLSCVDLTEDSESEDFSDAALPGVGVIPLNIIDKSSQENPSASVPVSVNGPSESVDIPVSIKDNLCPTSVPDLSAHSNMQDDYRQKENNQFAFALTNNTSTIPFPNMMTCKDVLSEEFHLPNVAVRGAKRGRLDSTIPFVNYGINDHQINHDPQFGVKRVYEYADTVMQQDYQKIIENHPLFKRDVDGDIPLHIAVAKEDLEKTKLLTRMMSGHQLDIRNRNEQTPMHLACYTNNAPILSCLLRNGANPAMVDADGNNMIHLGCIQGSMEIVDLMLEYYLENPLKVMGMLEMTNYDGYTPFHLAASRKDFKIMDRLMRLNCNLDAKDMKTGTTALVHALKNGDWDVGKYLIENGANVNVPTYAGLYSLDYVAISDNLELAVDLIKRNAESGAKAEFTNEKMKNLFESELRKRRRKRNRDDRKD